MRVMGIDPGSLATGFGIIEESKGRLRMVTCGAIKSKSKDSMPDRLHRIHSELAHLIKEFCPDAIAVEDIFFASNAKSTIKLGQVRGVALLAGVQGDVTIHEYTPLEVKQSVSGYGRADKHQVRDMVTALLQLKSKPEPLDASDALAVAICHIHGAGTRERIQKASARK